MKVKVIKLQFQHLNNFSKEEASVSFSYGANYLELPENEIQVTFVIKVQITQIDKDNKQVEIVNFEIVLGGIFLRKNELDDSINNAISILHSYAIPIITQTFALANFPPLNIPILDVNKIKAEKEIEK